MSGFRVEGSRLSSRAWPLTASSGHGTPDADGVGLQRTALAACRHVHDFGLGFRV